MDKKQTVITVVKTCLQPMDNNYNYIGRDLLHEECLFCFVSFQRVRVPLSSAIVCHAETQIMIAISVPDHP